MTDLFYLSASEALARFRAHTLSPVELVRALIARADELDPILHAFTHTYAGRALAAAALAEARYRDGSARPLEGIAVAIKDLHPITGEITTHGSLVFANNRDETTLPTVQRLLDAGAIVLARTASSEFGLANVTHSRAWGVTRNPWNPAMTPGGSSGGAGAALAAGMTTLADGSDYGGSIRIPASCCGLVGYKPPRGRNPGDSLDPFSHFGPLARTVGDAVLMQNVMSGPSVHDPLSLPDRVTLSAANPGIAGWRVAYSIDLGYCEVDPEVEAALRGLLDLLRTLGCEIEPVELDWTERVREAFEIHHDAADAAVLWMLLPSQRELLTDYAIAAIERGNAIRGRDVFATHEVRAAMYRSLGPVLARCELFVCPTTAVPAVAADHSPLADHRGWVMTYPFNMLSTLPVLSIPIGRSRANVPIGAQLVARPFDDQRVFRAAIAIEHAQGAWYANPSSTPDVAG